MYKQQTLNKIGRVNMRKPQRQKKYFAPQNEGKEHKCDFPGCNKAGEYRAPKDRRLKEYYWFCLEHVQEYNSGWNYYENLEDVEEEENTKSRRPRFTNFNSKIKYNFGFSFKDNFEFFDEYAPEFAAQNGNIYFNQTELEYLKFMELKPKDVSLESLKKSYKKLVKKYHPDLHQGDKEAEENFKKLSIAYKHLLTKLS